MSIYRKVLERRSFVGSKGFRVYDLFLSCGHKKRLKTGRHRGALVEKTHCFLCNETLLARE